MELALANHLDVIESISCLIGAFACVYLMQVILKERNVPWLPLQRLALFFLAISLIMKATYFFPEHVVFNGYRPATAMEDVALMFNLLVMSIRGGLIHWQRRKQHDDHMNHGEPAE